MPPFHMAVLSPSACVSALGLWVEGCVLMDGVEVGDGAVVRRATIDKQVIIHAGSSIGVDQVARAIRYTVSPNGILVIGSATSSSSAARVASVESSMTR